MNKKAIIIVLDSVGIGELPDAANYGDKGADTLGHIINTCHPNLPHMMELGLANIDGAGFSGAVDAPKGCYGKLREVSAGKDTTTGHWEIAGIQLAHAFPTFPNGFPADFIAAFEQRIGHKVIGNKPASGTAILDELGEEHLAKRTPIVYTSADSVFQIAANEAIVPVEKLYEICAQARELLVGKYGVGRVIARPFEGEWPYTRTSRRHDFSLEPPAKTMLDAIVEAGQDMIAVGKIHDIFAGRGMTEFTYTSGNTDGLAKTLEIADRDFTGLCFVNLVDFDMLYGHRRNPDAYAQALHEFDTWLPELLAKLGDDDCVIITADHGCDPGYLKHTDHTREYIPMIALGKKVKPVNLGTRAGFCDIAATVTELLGVPYQTPGRSFAAELV